ILSSETPDSSSKSTRPGNTLGLIRALHRNNTRISLVNQREKTHLTGNNQIDLFFETPLNKEL
ncbi:hypothetical protein RBK84_02745, partial [Pseudomonas aeruginosa]|uniref:hypothetical protein n=1 Tax=Pseudomonas aeruginosa TaxID=287 RepID=UPI0027D3D67D